MNEPLSRGEFLVHMSYLRENTEAIKRHLEELNGRTRKNSEDIARQDERLESVESVAAGNKADPAARMAGALGAGAAGAVALWQWLKG